jgi:uncharacterized protein
VIDTSRDLLYRGLPCVWDGSKYVLFSPFSLKVASLSRAELQDKEVLRLLRQESFFGRTLKPEKSTDVLRITLLATTDCQLRCTYCYMDAGAKPMYMAPETAIKGILGLRDHLKQDPTEVHISFFGGEPTLNCQLIEDVVRFTKERIRRHTFHVSTNGLIPRRTYQLLLSNNFSFTISLDGSKQVNDLHRRSHGGGSVALQVENVIKDLVQRNRKFNVRVTVTAETVRFLPDTVQYLSSLGVRFVHFEILKEAGRASLNDIKAPHGDLLLKYVAQALKKAEATRTFLMNSAFMNILTPTTHFCTSIRGDMFVITPSGRITSCYEVSDESPNLEEFMVGQVTDTGVRIDATKLSRLRAIDVERMNSCGSCFAKYICSGGCPKHNYDKTGELLRVDEERCAIKRPLVHMAILSLYRTSKKRQISPAIGTCVYENIN